MEELELIYNTPTTVTPTKASLLVQNNMPLFEDMLMVSTHGDIDKKWIKIPSRGSVKITEETYFMQVTKPTWTFPVIESD
jgi:hypothetical protein